MKKIILALIFISLDHYAQEWEWFKFFYSDHQIASSRSWTSGCVTNTLGDIYVVGNFTGSIQIDSSNYSSGGSAFIVKYDFLGNLIWAKILGNSSNLIIHDICMDNSGSCYITGRISGLVNLDTIQINNQYGSDIFIAKFNQFGIFEWASCAYGYTADDWAEQICIDKDGNLFITGFFMGNALFGSYSIQSYGATDIFIAKCTQSGNFIWARNAGSSNGHDYGRSLTIDSLGNVYVTGEFESTANFGGQYITSFGSGDIFLTKLDKDGNFIWSKNFGGTSYDYVGLVAISKELELVLTGSFRSGINGASFGSEILFSQGDTDIFVSKLYSSSGDIIWLKSFGSVSKDGGTGIAFDNNSNILVTGDYAQTVNFDNNSLISLGWHDLFVCKLNQVGNVLWANSFGDAGNDRSLGLTIDIEDNCFIFGALNGPGDFNYDMIKDGFLGKINNQIVPVELTSFTTNISFSKVQLSWSTASELNNHGFEIERSFEKTNWATIGFREGKGTTSEPQNYTYTDDISEISAQKLYYRLKQIDFNGNFEYSKIVEVEIIPTEFSLSQNYPNPFNPSTIIQYTIGSRQFVTLKVYDVLGKEVATLVNEEKPAGSFDVEFNASNIASGIYYYQLKAGDFIETRKMIYLK